MDDRLIRTTGVRRELGVSRATAYRMMTDGTLPAYRFTGKNGRRTMVRVLLKELRAWRDAHKGPSRSAA
jgi:excisionase family DNA binding protein